MTATPVQLVPSKFPDAMSATHQKATDAHVIPVELRRRQQWVVWRYEQRGDSKPTKIPVTTDNRMGSTTDPDTWTTFGEVIEANGFDGIGFVFTEDDPYVGIDLDNSIGDDGKLKPWSQTLVHRFDTYTEISPSGKGVKMWLRGTYHGDGTGKRRGYKDGAVEMYHAKRYFTVTGNQYPGTRNDITEQQSGIDEMCKDILDPRPSPPMRAQVKNEDPINRCMKFIDRCPDAVSGEGGHDKTLRAACECFRFGLVESDVWRMMEWFNNSKCRPQWSERELKHKIDSAAAKVHMDGDFGSRIKSPPADDGATVSVQHNLTDVGNAGRLVELHGADLHFCHPFNQWLIWDGRRWRNDDTSEIRRRAKQTVKQIYADAAQADNDNFRKALAEHARRSESESRIKAMIELAKSEPGIPVLPDKLDSDLWAFNVLNGTIDLHTGELRSHRRADLLTKLAPVVYDPDATFDMWDQFLAAVTNADAELIGFLQRAVGYSLCGDPCEEKLFLVHGPTAAGKSTFLEAMKGTLGDYATVADFESFLASRNTGGPRNDIARLAGARFVASVEVDEGRKFAAGLVKMLTGGETVSARRLYQESFEFQPQFTLWLACNHAPEVRADDDAMWRRVLRVPFEHTVPPANRDPTIKATLKDPGKAGPAILAWAVRGCLEWQRDGLQVPGCVQAATNAYRGEQDWLQDFIADCCTLDAEAWCASRDLRQAYTKWCEQNSDKPCKSRTFTAQIRARDCEPSQRNGVHGWSGIMVKTDNIFNQ